MNMAVAQHHTVPHKISLQILHTIWAPNSMTENWIWCVFMSAKQIGWNEMTWIVNFNCNFECDFGRTFMRDKKVFVHFQHLHAPWAWNMLSQVEAVFLPWKTNCKCTTYNNKNGKASIHHKMGTSQTNGSHVHSVDGKMSRKGLQIASLNLLHEYFPRGIIKNDFQKMKRFKMSH